MAPLLRIDRSDVVRLTKEIPATRDATRLPTRMFFGVQVVHVTDLKAISSINVGPADVQAQIPLPVRLLPE